MLKLQTDAPKYAPGERSQAKNTPNSFILTCFTLMTVPGKVWIAGTGTSAMQASDYSAGSPVSPVFLSHSSSMMETLHPFGVGQ